MFKHTVDYNISKDVSQNKVGKCQVPKIINVIQCNQELKFPCPNKKTLETYMLSTSMPDCQFRSCAIYDKTKMKY